MPINKKKVRLSLNEHDAYRLLKLIEKKLTHIDQSEQASWQRLYQQLRERLEKMDTSPPSTSKDNLD